MIITVESNGQQFVLNYGVDLDQIEAHAVSFILTHAPGGGPVISSFRVERAMPVEPLGLARIRRGQE